MPTAAWQRHLEQQQEQQAAAAATATAAVVSSSNGASNAPAQADIDLAQLLEETAGDGLVTATIPDDLQSLPDLDVLLGQLADAPDPAMQLPSAVSPPQDVVPASPGSPAEQHIAPVSRVETAAQPLDVQQLGDQAGPRTGGTTADANGLAASDQPPVSDGSAPQPAQHQQDPAHAVSSADAVAPQPADAAAQEAAPRPAAAARSHSQGGQEPTEGGPRAGAPVLPPPDAAIGSMGMLNGRLSLGATDSDAAEATAAGSAMAGGDPTALAEQQEQQRQQSDAAHEEVPTAADGEGAVVEALSGEAAEAQQQQERPKERVLRKERKVGKKVVVPRLTIGSEEEAPTLIGQVRPATFCSPACCPHKLCLRCHGGRQASLNPLSAARCIMGVTTPVRVGIGLSMLRLSVVAQRTTSCNAITLPVSPLHLSIRCMTQPCGRINRSAPSSHCTACTRPSRAVSACTCRCPRCKC